ncbi:MAG: hypothetical protein IJG51_00535 [Synergistaceae bacterium]|nr:hypothetical protein [Synergistaceae bacterium]MBQ3397355.1 hypothetical protein [Synergistaceae bacterium]MBQ3760282.1 hypothetical protein [Synergistaceae bacterium]MBQ6113870.1 hypothetical protein [Synergistaceae bacterium]MBQ6417596.1 hypothetical protein [Synergistaceae bacterium]
MTVLLEAGADPNYWAMSLFYMGTALHDAAPMYEDDAEVVRFVVKKLRLSRAGIGNVEAPCTPLIYAVLYDNPDAVNALLDIRASG